MQLIIKVQNLKKEFKISINKPGFKNKIKSIFKQEFNIFSAVDRINFEVKPGEKIAFLGPNGAGNRK